MAARPKGACESDSISNRGTINGSLQSAIFLELIPSTVVCQKLVDFDLEQLRKIVEHKLSFFKTDSANEI
jgi:hypothetical protein